jgi:hypothetical protein
MSAPNLAQLADQVLTRRKDRLRILYALFLAQEAQAPVTAMQLQKRVGLDDERFAQAMHHLDRSGYTAQQPGSEHVTVAHAGIVAVETALTRLDRDSGEFPPLRSILSADGSLPRKPE